MSEELPTLSPLFYNGTYDPLHSTLAYTSIYGDGTEITFEQLQILVNDNTTQAIIFGTRIGAAGLALIIMWMVSKNRKTPIFMINQSSLVLTIIQSALYLSYLMSNFGGIPFALTLFPQMVSSHDEHLYAAATLVQCLLVACIEISLIFQVRVIFKADKFRAVGVALTGISAGIGAATVAMWFFTAIKSLISVYESPLNKVNTVFYNISVILLACSINFMTLLLSVKLFFAFRARRLLGLKQFDSFHILLIMSTQTLIGPSILYILAYALNNKGVKTLTSIATLLVVLSLPLTSIWAAAANDAPHSRSFYPRFDPYPRQNRDDSSYISYSKTIDDKYSLNSPGRHSDGCSSKELDASTQLDIDLESHRSFVDKVKKNEFFSSPNKANSSIIEQLESLKTYTPGTADEEARAFWASAMNDSRDIGLVQSKTVFKELQ
ncbi:unnamed protein product [Kluyveromyces dobzhanskii CBS 2104]|uniref:WGS project CCBQ000000000 data, contig 00058 n=1 Tax=Kluyveromyces dobzhanskii CBS 2104 TaxID=1427455 RepID=A0A0A8LC24_9SACH|nr:unnamed protein product [Kluyveromyces dobzhanskii CBS 2104]